MTIGDDCAGDQPYQSFKRRHRSAPFGHWTHCLVYEGELNFDHAEKNPDVAKYQISEAITIIRERKLLETLKKVIAEWTDPLAVELAATFSYVSCIRAEEAK